MGKLLRAIADLDMYFMMAILATLTLGTGLILANPKVHTFDGPTGSWVTFAKLGLGPVHPSEEQWGIIIIGLAVLQLITMWQLVTAEGTTLPILGLARLVWGITCALYFAVGTSFLVNNPTGVGYLFLLIPGCAISPRVCVRVRHLVEGSSGGQGG